MLEIIDHPNPILYPGQKMYVLSLEEYAWVVPYVRRDDKIFLKTAFPSRKYTKKYMEKKDERL